MSEDSSNRMSEINKITKAYGKNGLKVLVLFKMLKMKVEEKIRQDYPGAKIDVHALNELCVHSAYELAKSESDNPSEEDIRSLVERLVKDNAA